MDNNPLVTLFVTKEKFIRNSRRVVVLTDKNLLSFERNELAKLKIPYREIQAIGPAQKATNFTIKTPQMVEVYIADTKDEKDICLAILYEFRKRVARKSEKEKKVSLIQRKSFTGIFEETTVEICNVSISKVDLEERVYSSKYIKDIQTIYSISDENDSFVIVFNDQSRTLYKVQGDLVQTVVSSIQTLLRKHYNHEVAIQQGTVEGLIPPPIELAPSERIFGFPIRKHSKRHNSMENRVFCLTSTHVYICDGATVVSGHLTSDIHRITIADEDHTKFQIDYERSTKSAPSEFYCDERDTIIANIMCITSLYQQQNSRSRPVFDLSGSPDLYYLRPSCELRPDPEVEEYYLNKLLKLKASSPTLVPELKEFNATIPLTYLFQTKEKRILPHVVDLLQTFSQQHEKGNALCGPIVIVLLQVLQRLLNSRMNYTDIRLIKNITMLFGDLIRSADDRIVTTAAITLLTIIEQPRIFGGKDAKAEAMNKSAFLSHEDRTSPIMTTLLSTIIQRSAEIFDREQQEKRLHTLNISVLLELLVSMVSSHAKTTSKEWFREIVPKLSRGRVLATLFELCKSTCFSIAVKATEIVKVIFQQASPTALTSLQDEARQQLAFLYQIYQAIDSRLDKQKELSVELVGLMAEGAPETQNLIERIFPKGLLQVLYTAPPPAPRLSRQNANNQSSGGLPAPAAGNGPRDPNTPKPPGAGKSRLKLNWEGLFRNIASEICTPSVLWNADTRKEVVSTIHQEIGAYESGKDYNRDTNKVWNHQEFVVDYPTLNKQIVVDHYYLGVILEQPDVLTLPDPVGFINHCFHKLLLDTVVHNRVRYLKAMSWCFSQHQAMVGELSFVPNLIQLLISYLEDTTHFHIDQVQALLEFVLTSFKCSINVRRFIDGQGVGIVARILKNCHCAEYLGSCVIALHVLLTAIRHVSSTNDRGYIKVPIPRAKRDLGKPEILFDLVRALLVNDDMVVGSAAHLLSELLDKNSAKAKNLHQQTGLLYFLFLYDNTAAGSSLMRLLQVLDAQQDPHLLRKFIPDTVTAYLQKTDPEESADVFYCSQSSPEVIWTKQMREILVNAMRRHLAPYLDQLRTDPHAVYQFQELEGDGTVEYPGLDDELRIGEYYVRNIIENPDWAIENPEQVLSEALQLVLTHSKDKVSQILLLRASAILFKKKEYRRKSEFTNFAGFPTILQLIRLDREHPDWSPENLELIRVSVELLFLSVWTSTENLTNFLKVKGLSTLCNLLWCCSRNVERCYEILTLVLKIVCRLLPSPVTREQVAMNTDIIRDVLSCLTVGQPFNVVTLAMQCLIELVQETASAEAIFKNGGHFYLLDFILSYDPSSAAKRPDQSPDVVATPQEQLNSLAVSACTVLGTISGVYSKTANTNDLTPFEVKLQRVLATLLTKGMLEQLRDKPEEQFLEGLSASFESPVSIWNESTRNELAQFIRTRIQQHQNSNQEESADLHFVFLAHQKEVQIEGIFLRLYLQQPDYRLPNSRAFTTGLLRYMHQLVEKRDHEQLLLVLGCVYNVLTMTQGLEKLVVASDSLDDLFLVLRDDSHHARTLHNYVLSIFLHTTSDQTCVDVMCSPQRLHEFTLFLQRTERASDADKSAAADGSEQRHILLEVLSNMVSCSSKSVIGITTSGLLLYLYHYVFTPTIDEQTRSQALSVLRQTKSSSGLDVKFSEASVLFLPLYMIAVLERPADFLYILNQTLTMPDLIWNSVNKGAAQQVIDQALHDFQRSGEVEWNYKAVGALNYAQLNQQLSVGFVYLDIYLQQPKTRLHNPKLFIDECLYVLSSNIDETLQVKIITCINQVLKLIPPWAHYFGEKPHQQLYALLQLALVPNAKHELQAQILTTYTYLVHSPVCRKKLTQVPVIEGLLHISETNVSVPAIETLVFRCIYLLVKLEAVFTKQLMTPPMVQKLIIVAEKKSPASPYALTLLRILQADRKLDPQISQLIASKEQTLLKERVKVDKPEWLQVSALVPALKNPYMLPMEADASSIKAASLRPSASTSTLPIPANVSASSTGAPIAPLKRAQTQYDPTTAAPAAAYTATALHAPASPASYPTEPQVYIGHDGTPAPLPQGPPPMLPSKPAEVRHQQEYIAANSPAHMPTSAPEAPITMAPPPAFTAAPGGPPPPPPPPPPAGWAPPKAQSTAPRLAKAVPPSASSDTRNDLLSAIRSGANLKHVDTPSLEDRKNRRQEPAANSSSGGGDQLMNALASALAARRTSLITSLAANPFADEEEDSEEEWN